MIRVLQIVDSMGYGGIQAFIMNVYRNIDTDSIQFDFLLHKKSNNSYEAEILTRGGRIYYVPPRNQGILKNVVALNDFFKKHREYSIVHMHESSLSYLTPLIVAKKYGVNKRIIHSHSSHILGRKINLALHKIGKKRIAFIATDYLACGRLAADWFFQNTKVDNKVRIINNGIDIGQFTYNEVVRNKVREELGVSDELLIGHVGRFNDVKNHSFLIDVFAEVLKLNRGCKLILVGDGTLRKQIEDKCRIEALDKKVIFTGTRTDVNELYQAMDCFVLPSLYEGFPVSLVECQAAGLPAVISDNITDEVVVKKNIIKKSLSSSPKEWAFSILANLNREPINDDLRSAGLDITDTVAKLTSVYLEKQ